LFCLALGLGALLAWDLYRRPVSVSYALPFVLWLLMMAAYLAAFVHWSVPRRVLAENWRAHRIEALAVAGLLSLAFVLRAWAVERIPYSLGGDEATQGLGALEFLTGQRTNMFAISNWYFYPNFGYFSLAASLALFGRNVTGLRMLATIVGSASLLPTYLLARRWLGRQAALAAALFLAGQHYHLHMSRLGSINIFDALFTPLLAYLLLEGLRQQRPGWFAAAGLTMGVAQYYYNGAKLLPFLVAALMVYLALAQRDRLRASLAHFGVLALGAGLAFIPLGIYEQAHPGSFAGRVAQVSIFHSGWLANEALITGKSATTLVGEAFLRAALAFNYFTDRSFWYHPTIPFLDSASAVLFVLGMALAARYAWRNMGYAMLLAWFWLAVILGGVLTTLPPASERLVVTTPALALLVVLALTHLAGYGQRLWGRLASVWAALLPVATLALLAVNTAYYFVHYTPTHVYGNPTAEVMTRLLKDDLAQRQGNFRVCFFGAPHIYYESALPRFLAPDVEGMDVPIGWAETCSVEPAQTALFVFLPQRLDELEDVRARYAQGMQVPVYSSADGRLLYVLYEVAPMSD